MQVRLEGADFYCRCCVLWGGNSAAAVGAIDAYVSPNEEGC